MELELAAWERFRDDVTSGLSRILDVLHTGNDLLRQVSEGLGELQKAEKAAPAEVPNEHALLSDVQVAKMLGIAVSVVRKWRVPYTAGGPPFIKVGRRVLYPRKAVIKWIEREQQTPTIPDHWYGEIRPRVGKERSTRRVQERCPGSGGSPKRTQHVGTVDRGVCGVCGAQS